MVVRCSHRPQHHPINMSKRGLDSLPVELLFTLLHQLPTSSLISLKLSSRQLFSKLPSPSSDSLHDASRCERRACWRNFGERKDRENGRRRCVLCDVCAPEEEFKDEAPICKSHQGRFMTTTIPAHLEPDLKARLEQLYMSIPGTIWVSFKRKLCVHRKLIQEWDDVPRSCNCECDSCGHWPVWCYVRIHETHVRDRIELVSYQLSEDGRQVNEERRPLPCSVLWDHTDSLEVMFHIKSKQSIAVPVLELKE